MKKIKLGFIINSLNNSGPSNVLLNIINEISPKIYDVTIITIFEGNDINLVERLNKKKIKVIDKGYQSRLKYLLFGKKELEQDCLVMNFDIIHTHGFIPDCVCSKIKTSAKKISTIHCNLFEDYTDTYGKIRGIIYAWMEIISLRKFDRIICCSESVKKALQKYITKAEFILNGVNLKDTKIDKIKERKKLHIPQNSTVFIYVGSITKRKNVAMLIEKFTKYHLKNEYLLILGEGELYDKCKENSDANVIFLGFQNNPTKYLKLSDFYISASKSEGFSISIIEAMGCGLGLFLSDIPSHNETMQLDSEIYLGEIFTQYNFEEKLQDIRKNQNKINHEIIKRLQKEKLSAKSMSVQYEKKYIEMLGENNEKSKCYSSRL